MLYRYKDKEPEIGENVFIAPDAVVLGDVTIGKNSSIWFGSVVRGDVHFIRIGENTNVQDLSMLHVTTDRHPLIIGSYVSLGHRVTLHGCTLADYAFVGIGAIALDGSSIGEFSILAAGSLLPPGKEIPPGMVAMGSPAKVVREITDKEKEMILRIPESYSRHGRDYGNGEIVSPISASNL